MKQWSVAKLNKENAGTISERYELPPIICALMDIRGFVTEEDIRDFLFNESTIEDPFELKDMDKACERIQGALNNGERICVYGDFDADGVTSTSLLYSYLDTVGADVTYYIPARDSEGYGMHNEAIDKIKADGVELIVTVDNGISAVEEVAYAKSLGIDTVVTDHHLPGDKLPEAYAVVDMHRPDCKSKFKTISGVGVAFKLVCALEGEYADVDMLLDNYSDLLSIGTIGDIMPLVKDNRVFVKRGLKSINNSDRAGINALCEASGLANKEISAGNISFGLVPRINAAGRLGLSSDSVTLLTTEDYSEAQKIAVKISDDNTERQRIEKEIITDIEELISQNPGLVNDRVIIIDGNNWHQGVIGIVSARVKDMYGKPCIIITKDGDICKGSGRSIEGFDIWKAVSSCSDLLDHYGGHPMAVGLALIGENISEFRRRINEFAKNNGEMPFDRLNIDLKLNSSALNVELAKDLKYLAPFGNGNPVPVFQLSRLKLTGITPLASDKHLKLSLTNGKNRISALWFFTSTQDNPFKIGDEVDLAVNLDVNVYKNTESLSIIIKDIKFSNVDYTDYIRSNRLYESFESGEKLSKSQLLNIIPTRADFALIYRRLRDIGTLSNVRLDVLLYRIDPKLTYAKLRVALRAMSELGLIEYSNSARRASINVPEIHTKVNLEDAPVIKHLKEVYQSEQV